MRLDKRFNKNEDLLENTKEKIYLNQVEKAYINQVKPIRYVIDPDWMPVEAYDPLQKKHVGIVADYFDMISEITGLKFELFVTNNWSETLQAFKAKQVDLISCISKTPNREKKMKFTESYMEFPIVIIGDDKSEFIYDLNELNYKKVVINKDFAIAEYLIRDHPKIKLIESESTRSCLEMIVQKKTAAYIANLATVTYALRKQGLSNLKIIGKTDYNYHQRIALQNEIPDTLLAILNKAIMAITETDRIKIFNKWVKIKYEKQLDYGLVWKILAGFFIFFIGVFFWIRRLILLNRKIKQANSDIKLANQRIESATRAKSEFLANMSHEIRTPMNGVIGAADLALGQDLTPTVEKYLKIIHSSGYSLLGIINDILDFSKIEAGKLDLENTPFDMNELLETIVALFIGKTEEKKLKLLLDIEPGLKNFLIGDSLRLQQIITNLVGNAVKFTEKGGTIPIGQ